MELKFENIQKNYGSKKALKGVSTTLTPGIYGLLGPNGAGKSTLMNILTGNIRPSAGKILFNGQDIESLGIRFHGHIGYCPQQQALYPGFTAQQFLFYMASLQNMKKADARKRIEWALDAVSLSDVKNKQIRTFSGGMKQRLLLAQSLLHDPDILILDEPTAGLDPRQRIAVRNLIGEIAANKIVLISTHVVQDVEYIAKELILLSDGLILGQDTPANLLRDMEGKVWEIQSTENSLNRISDMGIVSGAVQDADGITVRVICDRKPMPGAVAAKPTLEEVYLHHFGEADGL